VDYCRYTSHVERFLRLLSITLCITAATAVVPYLFQSLTVDRQADTQLISQTLQLLHSVQQGTVVDFLLSVRKYPLLPSWMLSGLYGLLFVLLIGIGRIDDIAGIYPYLMDSPVELYFVNRFFIFISAIATGYIVSKISRLLFPTVPALYAPAVLTMSLLFLVFATAVRPHILTAFWTTLTLWASLEFTTHKQRAWQLAAFASAAGAFCTLQNGLFALLFPVLATIYTEDGFRWRQLVSKKLFFVLCIVGMISVFVGYPFLLGKLFGIHDTPLGFDLGHNYLEPGQRWTGAGFVILLEMAVGQEPLLAIFFVLGLILLLRQRLWKHTRIQMLLLYLAVYILCFGFYAGSQPRFFLVLLPLAAVIGGYAAYRYRTLFIACSVIAILMHGRLALLGIRPVTLDTAAQIVSTHTTGSIYSEFPWYMLGIPPTQESIIEPRMEKERFIKAQPSDLPNARPYVSSPGDADILVMHASTTIPPNWMSCEEALSSPSAPSVDRVFLWNEMPWGFYWIFRATHMGPNITIYCKA
jgi:MFS family permease